MKPAPLLMLMAILLGSGCHARSSRCCPDANGSMTISQGGDDLGEALLGVTLFITLQMLFNPGR
jgi:hypothetical protein